MSALVSARIHTEREVLVFDEVVGVVLGAG